jgi:hypothetical protein
MGVLLAAAGCGSQEEPSSQGSEPSGTAVIGQPLLTGAEAVTSGGQGRAETTINIDQSGGHTIEMVAYNDRDGLPFVDYSDASGRKVFTGASQMGWSVKVDGGAWVAGKLRPNDTANWPVFWGDPAVSQMPGTTNVYFANVAVPKSRWTGSKTGEMATVIAGAVVARSSDSGGTFSTAFQYLTNNDGDYDGSALEGASGSRMYAAFWHYPSAMDVYLATGFGAAFVRLPDPFPGKNMSLHPRLRHFGPDVYIVARDAFGGLWINGYSVASGRWGTPALVASGLALADITLTTAQGTAQVLRDNGGVAYEVAIKDSNFAVVQARIWYPVKNGNFTLLQGSVCDINTTAITFSCSHPANWTTPAGFNSYRPAVAVGDRRNPSLFLFRNVWRISYMTEEMNTLHGIPLPLPQGQLTVAFGTFDMDASNGNFSMTFPLAGETPCPSTTGIWGDYDYMRVLDNGTASPKYVRPFTDSTGGSCVASMYQAQPQNISQIVQ